MRDEGELHKCEVLPYVREKKHAIETQNNFSFGFFIPAILIQLWDPMFDNKKMQFYS